MTHSTYTYELSESILELVATGKSMTKACEAHGIKLTTFLYWVDQDYDGLIERSARARDTGVDALVDECIEIVDETPPMDDNGRTDSGFVQHQRLRFDARLRLAAKLNHKKYGDRIQTDVSIEDNRADRLRAGRARIAAALKAQEAESQDD